MDYILKKHIVLPNMIRHMIKHIVLPNMIRYQELRARIGQAHLSRAILLQGQLSTAKGTKCIYEQNMGDTGRRNVQFWIITPIPQTQTCKICGISFLFIYEICNLFVFQVTKTNIFLDFWTTTGLFEVSQVLLLILINCPCHVSCSLSLIDILPHSNSIQYHHTL